MPRTSRKICRFAHERQSVAVGNTPKNTGLQSHRWSIALPALLMIIVGSAGLGVAHNDEQDVVLRMQEFSDPDGRFANFNAGGPTDTTKNAFFQDLGTNGRRCVTCHQASDAWSVTPTHIRARFEATHGMESSGPTMAQDVRRRTSPPRNPAGRPTGCY
jgi:hypothetical protein